MSIRGRDIIMVANQPWDMALGSNCKNISIELAKNNRILHVNPPIDRKLYYANHSDPYIKKIKNVLAGQQPALEQVDDTIWVLNPDFIAESINWIPVPLVHDILNKRTNRKLARRILKSTQKLDFSNYLVFNDNVISRAFYLKEMLRPDLYMYYIRDYLISQPYYKKQGLRLEKELIKKSDIVLANSLYLRDYAKQFNDNAYYVGQGCELNIFDASKPWPKPPELIGITSPVIGYIGYLTSFRLDISLIEYIAEKKKDWVIILVGPEDDVFKNSNLHNLKNVVFTGNKKPEQLQHYVQHFDVCINPQLVNDLTIGNYPRKIDEYLAMGKPTVATKTRAMEIFSDYCLLAENPNEFVSMLETALKGNSAEKEKARIAFAKSHNWTTNVKEMCEIIEKNTVGKNRPALTPA